MKKKLLAFVVVIAISTYATNLHPLVGYVIAIAGGVWIGTYLSN